MTLYSSSFLPSSSLSLCSRLWNPHSSLASRTVNLMWKSGSYFVVVFVDWHTERKSERSTCVAKNALHCFLLLPKYKTRPIQEECEMGHYYDGCCCSSFLFPLLLILILANITASAPSNTRTTDSSIRGPSSSSSSPSSLLHSESQERNSLDSTILKCPEEHSRYYCVNGGKCFIVNTGVSYEYSCE